MVVARVDASTSDLRTVVTSGLRCLVIGEGVTHETFSDPWVDDGPEGFEFQFTHDPLGIVFCVFPVEGAVHDQFLRLEVPMSKGKAPAHLVPATTKSF